MKGYHNFTLRISDGPADFARAYAQAKKWDPAFEAYSKVMGLEPGNRNMLLHQDLGEALAQSALAHPGRWKAAEDAFERAWSIEPNADWIVIRIMRCYLALNDATSYRPLCERLIAQAAKDPNLDSVNRAVWLAVLLPDPLSSYDEAKKCAKKLVDGKKVDPAFFRTYGAVLYRARQETSALRQLEQAIEAQNKTGSAFDWVFLAMARHRLRQPGDREALARAKALARAASYDWTLRADIDHLLEEARVELGLPAAQ